MKDNETMMNLDVAVGKDSAISAVESFVQSTGMRVAERNMDKPWGAYWRFDSAQTQRFAELFFPDLVQNEFGEGMNFSPKFLLVAPGSKLSWQYHHRRSEIWSVVFGEVAIKTSDNDEEPEEGIRCVQGETVTIGMGKRHRLIGLEKWSLVAEIWMHDNPDAPSNEEDIVRLADDYQRK